MKLIILGSGTNRVSLKRSSPAYLLELGKKNVLIDTGNGCIKQLLKVKKHILDVDAILYSHFHHDHYLELPVILNCLYAQSHYPWLDFVPKKPVKKLKIFGPTGVQQIFDANKREVAVEVKPISKGGFKLYGCQINVAQLEHVPNGEIIGYRIQEDKKVLVFTSDSKKCAASVKLAQGADVLLHAVGLTSKMAARATVHPSFADVGKVAAEAKVKKLVLTHFYPIVEKYNYLKEIRKYYKGPIVVARDLMKIEI